MQLGKTMSKYTESPYWHRYLVTDPALVARAIREEHVNSRGLRLHLDVYQREDDTPTILFVSGTGAHARCYAEFLFQLHSQGFRVVSIDLQGHGLSEGMRGSFTIEELVENIYDVTTWAIERYGEKVGISGSSLGGILALYAVANDPRLESAACHNVAVLSEPDCLRITRAPNLLRTILPLGRLAARLLPELRLTIWLYLDPQAITDDPRILEVFVDDPLTLQALPLRSIVSQSQAAPARPIEEIETPAMILHAEGDRIFPLDYCQAIYDRLTCPKRFELIPGADHLVFAPPYLDRSLPPLADWFRETLGPQHNP
jgi:alpha-beta hydrolase superfamily lysophospholipase